MKDLFWIPSFLILVSCQLVVRLLMVCTELSFSLLSDLLRTVDFLLTSSIESIPLNHVCPPAQPSHRHAYGAVVDFFLCLMLAGAIVRLAPPLTRKGLPIC